MYKSEIAYHISFTLVLSQLFYSKMAGNNSHQVSKAMNNVGEIQHSPIHANAVLRMSDKAPFPLSFPLSLEFLLVDKSIDSGIIR